jgi:hypothetical protein
MRSNSSDIVTQDEGLSRGVREALADPIVQALLAADRLDPRDIADLSRRMAARLSPHRETTLGAGADGRFPLGCI